MRKRLVDRLVRQADVAHDRRTLIRALVLDEAFFLLVAPWMLLGPAWLACRWWWRTDGAGWDAGLGLVALLGGLAWSLWAVHTQWTVGRGTPSLKAPTTRLVTSGPYRYTRNPIQFGALLYLAGWGLIVFSWRVALVALLAGTLVGVAYIRLVEERELSRRFGVAYEAYRERTRFLIPGPPRKRSEPR